MRLTDLWADIIAIMMLGGDATHACSDFKPFMLSVPPENCLLHIKRF